MNTFTVGLDLGQAQDYSALCVVERSVVPEPGTGRNVGYHAVRHLHRWKLGTPYTDIVEDVAELTARHPLPGSTLAVDATGVGRAVVDMFRVADLPVRMVPISITGVTNAHPADRGAWFVPKKDLVAVIQTLIHGDRLYIVPELKDAKILGKEIRQFRVKVTTAGNETFEALRERDHDDMVLSVALACWYHERGGNRVIFHVLDPVAAREAIEKANAVQPPEEPLIAEHTPEEIEAELKRVMEKEKQDFWKRMAGGEEPGGFVDQWRDWR